MYLNSMKEYVQNLHKKNRENKIYKVINQVREFISYHSKKIEKDYEKELMKKELMKIIDEL